MLLFGNSYLSPSESRSSSKWPFISHARIAFFVVEARDGGSFISALAEVADSVAIST
jgi:hypothetical protein